jgi:hypothetical protein
LALKHPTCRAVQRQAHAEWLVMGKPNRVDAWRLKTSRRIWANAPGAAQCGDERAMMPALAKLVASGCALHLQERRPRGHLLPQLISVVTPTIPAPMTAIF